MSQIFTIPEEAMTSNDTALYTASASGVYQNMAQYYPWKAFELVDGNSNTNDFMSAVSTLPAWIKLTLKTPKYIALTAVNIRSSAYSGIRRPFKDAQLVIEFTNNQSETITLPQSPAWSAGERKTFPITQTTRGKVSSITLNITSLPSGNEYGCSTINELSFDAAAVTPSSILFKDALGNYYKVNNANELEVLPLPVTRESLLTAKHYISRETLAEIKAQNLQFIYLSDTLLPEYPLQDAAKANVVKTPEVSYAVFHDYQIIDDCETLKSLTPSGDAGNARRLIDPGDGYFRSWDARYGGWNFVFHYDQFDYSQSEFIDRETAEQYYEAANTSAELQTIPQSAWSELYNAYAGIEKKIRFAAFFKAAETGEKIGDSRIDKIRANKIGYGSFAEIPRASFAQTIKLGSHEINIPRQPRSPICGFW